MAMTDPYDSDDDDDDEALREEAESIKKMAALSNMRTESVYDELTKLEHEEELNKVKRSDEDIEKDKAWQKKAQIDSYNKKLAMKKREEETRINQEIQRAKNELNAKPPPITPKKGSVVGKIITFIIIAIIVILVSVITCGIALFIFIYYYYRYKKLRSLSNNGVNAELESQ